MSDDYGAWSLDALEGLDPLEENEITLPVLVPSRPSSVWTVAVLVGVALVGLFVTLELTLLGAVVPVAMVAIGVGLAASAPPPAWVPGPAVVLGFSRRGLMVDGRLRPGLQGYSVERTRVVLRWGDRDLELRVDLTEPAMAVAERSLAAVLRLEELKRGEAPEALTGLREQAQKPRELH